MNLITINGIPIKNPSKYDAQTATLVDGARNVEGFFIGDIIREDMAKIEASWLILSGQEWADILALFDSKRGGNFINEVTFLNQTTNQFETRSFYVSDRLAGIKLAQTADKIYYEGPKLSLVEV